MHTHTQPSQNKERSPESEISNRDKNTSVNDDKNGENFQRKDDNLVVGSCGNLCSTCKVCACTSKIE
jgi:hypothetical protein